jgi:4-amino-4-deoxy-L-arabinose transferase-like glycosyltransferase
VAAALVIALPAGRAPIWDPNEARYMLLARDILEHGRWLIPDLREPYLNLGLDGAGDATRRTR